MIAPDMATMLSFIVTDAAIARRRPAGAASRAVGDDLQRGHRRQRHLDLRHAAAVRHRRGGRPGAAPVDGRSTDRAPGGFPPQRSSSLMQDLALQIVRDGEGARKLVEITVTGADIGTRRPGASPVRSPIRRWSRRRSPARTPTGAASSWPSARPARRPTATGWRSGSATSASPSTASAIRTTREAAASAVMKHDEIAIRVDLGLGGGRATRLDLRPDQGLCRDQWRLPELTGPRFRGCVTTAEGHGRSYRTSAVTPDLALVAGSRRSGFRAWPAASVQYDGSWQIRLTAGHPVEAAELGQSAGSVRPSRHRQPHRAGRAALQRLRPAAGLPADAARAAATRGLLRRDRLAPVRGDPGDDRRDRRSRSRRRHRPDAAAATSAATSSVDAVHGRDQALKPGLTEVSELDPAAERPVRPRGRRPGRWRRRCASTTTILPACSNWRRAPTCGARDTAATVVAAALRWARQRGAERAWLQVESGQQAGGRALPGLGFGEVYRYAYRQRGEA